MPSKQRLHHFLHPALADAMALRGETPASLGRGLRCSPRTIRRYLVDGMPLDVYLDAARHLASQPMVDALLRAFRLPTAGDQLGELARAFARRMKEGERAWVARGYDVRRMAEELDP